MSNLARPAGRVVPLYNQHGAAEQWTKESKGAIKWTQLSCRTFSANAERLQLHALADGTVVADQPAREIDQIGAKVVGHGRYMTFQLAEVGVWRQMFAEILLLIARLRAPPAPA
jgi:hypothetical protein